MAPGLDDVEIAERWGPRSLKSVLEVDVQSADDLPFEAPVDEYLEEALMGLRGSLHDGKTRQTEPKLRRYVDSLLAIARARGAGLQSACAELFWVTLGLAFGRVAPEAVDALRDRLSQSWHITCVTISTEIPVDVEARDWVKTALPVVLVQAVYRMLIDGFPFDRAQLVSASSQLIDKLMHIVHFEITGFQKQPGTTRKERRRLFLKYVVDSPHISLEKLEKDQQRQELLCSQNKGVHDEPLTFGNVDRSALEDNQLKHLLEIRQDSRRQAEMHSHGKQKRTMRGSEGHGQWAVPRAASQYSTSPTSSLGVERYEGLAERGAEIHRRQLRELARNIGDMAEHQDENDEYHATRHTSRPSSAADPDTTAREEPGLGGTIFTRVAPPSNAGDGGTLRRSGARTGDGKAKSSSEGVPRMVGGGPQQEKDKSQCKTRKDKILARINAPLPQEFCQRKVATDWVSPAVSRLYGDDGGRNVLRKPPSEAFHLQMDSPVIARPASAPRISPQKVLQNSWSKSSASSQRASQGPSRRSTKEEVGNNGFSGSGGLAGTSRSISLQSGLASPESVISALQRRTLMGRSPTPVSKNDAAAETIVREVKPISMAMTMQRLENMSKLFRQQAFGEYMKEYDIFTGDKKTRLNEKRLRDEEHGYVRDMQSMVGGPALGVNPFTQSQLMRMAKVSEGTGNKGRESQSGNADRTLGEEATGDLARAHDSAGDIATGFAAQADG